ncbi:class I SAM-dependent methyltransferase [Dysgonomonas sp. HDW5A]|uniref:class I SAM-dependent methyltransferase n=1 Tax=Dysgonomonas sp. HDW5A TaxID=2714926 RepID=UPI00140819D2|nr:class I SAM-dependent methyltransferase [Dysgonomonas sp. HDW5A]QIK59184.1 class I SAM-dependent methyltransferase [Dysgonomonas sp. HDW5A]
MKYDNEDLYKQLRCPVGAEARQVGESMFQSNSNMIFKTIDILEILPNTKVLEIGFGNGMHLSYIFEKECLLMYEGIDISKAMVDEATLNNYELVKLGKVAFKHITESDILCFTDSSFDYCFSVNTLYFWDNPQKYIDEIYRVLQDGGKIAITFISKSFGEMLPFTKKGFVFYEIEDIELFLNKSGFCNVQSILLAEDAISKDGQRVERPFFIVTAIKCNKFIY